MRTILLAFANAEAATKVRNALVAAGLAVGRTCPTGAALLQQAMLEPGGGVIVLPPRLSDMTVPDLLSRLPDTFDLIVLFSQGQLPGFGPLPGVTFLETPLPPAVLAETVRSLLETRVAASSPRPRIAQGGSRAPVRSTDDEQALRAAKAHLIRHCGYSEEQAHRSLQKRSMESGIRLAEIARRVLEEGSRCE